MTEKTWRVVLRALGFIVAGLALLVILSNVCTPLLLGGGQLFTTTTGSMAPALPLGSLEVLTRQPTAQLRPGDVIGLRLPVTGGRTDFVVHRVVSIAEADQKGGGVRYAVVTRGDANDFQDPPRTVGAEVLVETRVVRPLFGVLPLGSYLNWIKGHIVAVVAVAVAGLLPAILLPARKESQRRP